MGLKLENIARGNLAAPLSTGDTMVRLRAGQGARFPELVEEGDWFPLVLANEDGAIEITKATTRIGDTILVERGQEGTAQIEAVAGDPVYLALTVAALQSVLGSAGPLAITISDATA